MQDAECQTNNCLSLALLILRLPKRFLRTLLLRGVVLWFLARIMALVVIAWAADVSGVDLSDMSAPLPAWTLPACAALVFVDLRRRKEVVLLHNLGVTTANAVAFGTIPSVLIEATIVLVRS